MRVREKVREKSGGIALVPERVEARVKGEGDADNHSMNTGKS